MKSNVSIPFAVGAMCAAASLAFASDEITAEKYPDADTVIVNDKIETVYQADGTYVTTDEEWTKALTERGRRSLSTISIDYSLRYGKGEIVLVEIIGADGKARPVDFRSTLKEATDNSSTGANIYDPLDKTLSCAVPGLKVGETRHIITRREATKSRVKDSWASMELLESTVPIARASVRIDGPISRPLRSVAVRHPLGNVTQSVVTNGDRVVWSWVASNSPQMFTEPSMPPYWTQAQHVRVSTVGDWRELSRWYWELSLPHLERTNAAMTNKVAEIKAQKDGGDLVRRIYRFVSQEIRYMGLTMEDTSPGYAPHDVCLTFDNRYGVCRDKAALLVAMLRIAGFEAYPVLISASKAKMDTEVPTPFFNHAIAAVKLDGKYVLMDPTDESSRDLLPAYLSDCSYLVAHPEGETLLTSPVVAPEKNSVAVTGKGRLEKDGSLLIEYAMSFRGINDNAYRRALLTRKPEERRKFFEKLASSVAAGAELLRCEIFPKDLQDTESELKATILVKCPETLLRGETRDEMTIPSISSALGAANWLFEGRTALEKRKYPLKLLSTAQSSEKVEIDLAGAVGDAIVLPDEERMEGGYTFTRSFKRVGDTLVFSRSLSVSAVEFSPEDYLDLRERIKRVEKADRARPVFAKNPLANANQRVISRVLTYDLNGPSSWVSTNTVVKEILTYEGKKSSAELKFSFNPSWKTVELVSAVVSNRDGRVSRATEKEMSVLDAGWVSSAPRYPASKELVVNLPSVEVGSVITYTTVTRVVDSPIPFIGNYYFDTFTPTDFLSVRVGDWKREVRNPKLLADEPMLPSGVLWRDIVSISSNSFEKAAAAYRALDPEPLDPSKVLEEAAVYAAAQNKQPAANSQLATPNSQLTNLRLIRDWMSRNVRCAGPGFSEIRLADHVVDPATVVRERYATRIGYVRTLCALLKGAGYDADIVFAGDTAEMSEAVLGRDICDFPNVARFPSALCRVRMREGGFLWWGGDEKTYFLGLENEYTPLGTTGYEGSMFVDPRTGGFDTIAIPDKELSEDDTEIVRYAVRENGAVDLDFLLERRGASVGGARKRYAEMLPELRSRHFQQLLGSIAQAASATRELKTDVEGYPFTLEFSAFIPGLAVVSGDAISFRVPQLGGQLFGLTGSMRENPIGVGGESGSSVSRYIISFPEGYAKIEHLPSPAVVRNPLNPEEVWFETSVSSSTKDGVVTVEIETVRYPRRAAKLPPDYFALLKDWSRAASSEANATIVIRR